MADLNPGDGNAETLRRFWLKHPVIAWGTPGDMTRCMALLKRHMPGREAGYCANLHKRATGVWPGDSRNL
jgi:hypothetical protein